MLQTNYNKFDSLKLLSNGPNAPVRPNYQSGLKGQMPAVLHQETNVDSGQCTCFLQCICCPKTPIMGTQDSKCTCATYFSAPEESYCCKIPSCVCVSTRCTCNICTCQRDTSNLFPKSFRNKIKSEIKNKMIDEMMQVECAEIRKLMYEYECQLSNCDKPSIDCPISTQSLNPQDREPNEEVEVKSIPDEVAQSLSKEDQSPQAVEPKKKGQIKFSVEEPDVRNASTQISKQQIISPDHRPYEDGMCKVIKWQKKKKHHLKKETSKPNRMKFLKGCYCHKPSLTKKPLRISFYFSGGTEHYGVKQRHDRCLNKYVPVPSHMGWLWNINNPATGGTHERYGWRPGVIEQSVRQIMDSVKPRASILKQSK